MSVLASPALSTPLLPVTRARPAQADGKEIAEVVWPAVSGEAWAIERLIGAVRPTVVSYCRGRLGRTAGGYELADDVAQETCLGIVSALPRFRDMGCPFLAFVYGIAAHKVADAQRREMRTPSPVEELPDRADDAPGPEESVVRLLQARRARALLDMLPEQQREILLLRVVSGMSAEATGQVLNLSAGNVRVQQHRALKRLRGLIPSRQLADT